MNTQRASIVSENELRAAAGNVGEATVPRKFSTFSPQLLSWKRQLCGHWGDGDVLGTSGRHLSEKVAKIAEVFDRRRK